MNFHGSSSRPGQIHHDWAGPLRFAGRATDVSDHRFPFVFAIVRTVDPHTVRALLQDVPDPAIILRRLGGQSDHDADTTAGGRLSKQVRSVLFDSVPPSNKVLQ